MSNVKIYSLKLDGNKNITPNFKIKEFRCKDGNDKIFIDYTLACLLQLIRYELNVPLLINSAYRTRSYNEKVGGAKNSYHISGKAFDVSMANTNVEILTSYAYSLNINGIITYNTWVHIDTRENIFHADYRVNHKFIGTKVTIKYPNILTLKGSKNYIVCCIQYMLNKKGFNVGKEDGICGSKTEKGIKDFQEKYALKVDGIVGNNTWNKLFNF